MGKSTTVFRRVFVLQVCKFNANYAIKFPQMFQEENFVVRLSEDVS